MDVNGLGTFFAVSAGLIFFFFIITVVLYVLKSLGLYKLAVSRNVENPWLAWIPIADLYILGKLIIELKIGSWNVPSIELVLPIASIITIILASVPVIGILVDIAYFILFLFALYKLYVIFNSESAVVWVILSIIFSFLIPIFIFILGNRVNSSKA